MKASIWDILSIVTILATFCLCIGFSTVLMSDQPLSLFSAPAPTAVPTSNIVLVTPTPTIMRRVLPPTWTPTPMDAAVEGVATLKVTQTLGPTSTGFVIASFTPSPTITPTATLTYTPTLTSTNTSTPTMTMTFTQVPSPTNTLVPTKEVSPTP